MGTRVHTWIFVGSMLLAILAGLGQLKGDWAIWVLAVLGLLLAFLNRSKTDTAGFLLPAIALQMSAGAAQAIPAVGEIATSVLKNVVTFMSGVLLFMAAQAIVSRLDFKSPRVFVELLGLLLAILGAFGMFGKGSWPIAALAAIGVVVGVLRVIGTGQEKPAVATQSIARFLLSAIALLLSASAFNNVPVIGPLLATFFTNVVILVSAVMLVFAFVAAFRWLEQSTEA